MSGFRYSHPLDNLLRTATSVTVTLANELPQYEAENLSNGDPSDPFKADAGTVRVVWGWAAAVFPQVVALLNSNLDVAARWQGSNDPDFDGSPGPDIDVAFGIPVYNAQTGFFTSPWLDMSAYAARQYWSLLVTGNTLDVIVGEMWLGSTIRDLSHHLRLDGSEYGLDSHTVTHETGYGVDLSYEQSTERESVGGTLYLESEAEFGQIKTLAQATHRSSRPFLFIPDTSVDDAWHAKLMESQFLARPLVPGSAALTPLHSEVHLTARMTSRGMPWVDPDA